jgi:hypothetical protein
VKDIPTKAPRHGLTDRLGCSSWALKAWHREHRDLMPYWLRFILVTLIVLPIIEAFYRIRRVAGLLR